jgi:flagellar motility protein MotE (MotC chaperone)
MIRYIRELRLIPIALIASACLLVLKTADLVLHSSYFLPGDNAPLTEAEVSVVHTMPDGTLPSGSASSWAQQMFNFPSGGGSAPATAKVPVIAPVNMRRLADKDADKDNVDITGSVTAPAAPADGKPPPLAPLAPLGKDAKPAAPPIGTVIPTEGPALPTGAERAILERLQARREELDTRARELDIRESLIQAAEKRMEGRLAELKEVEARIKVESAQKDDAQAARFKDLVTMYENMKPRDAAKIFDGLDLTVLIEVVSEINPRKMSDIMAQMSADTAERLTVELANKAQQVSQAGGGAAALPKIDGQPKAP